MVAQVAITEKKNERGPFTQLPNILFDTAYEGLSNLDRWLTATILRIGWNWKPNTFYQVSLSELSEVSGISRGYLCPCNGKTKREGMLYKLQRLGLILIKKAIGKNAPYFLAITEKLWRDNSVYSVNTKKERNTQSVYSVDTSLYSVNTSDYLVNTSVYSVDTDEAIKPLAERDDSTPNTNKTSNTYKTESLTNVSDARDEIADAHQRGYQGMTIRVSTEPFQFEQEPFEMTLDELAEVTERLARTYLPKQGLSTPLPQEQWITENDNHSHSHSPLATCNVLNAVEEAAAPLQQPSTQNTMATTESALQADVRENDVPIEHATMSSTQAALQVDAHQFIQTAKMVDATTPMSLFPATRPVSEEAVKPASSKETKKPRGNKKVVEVPPIIQLTEQQRAFWLLWCDLWFNQDIPPDLNETAFKHVALLAPYIKTKEQLESLAAFARHEVERAGTKRKHIFLGNLKNSYALWKQEQGKQEQSSQQSRFGGLLPGFTADQLRAMPY